MYNLILKKDKDKERWRVLVISATLLFSCVCLILIVVDNTYGIFDSDTNTNCTSSEVTSISTIVIQQTKFLSKTSSLEETKCQVTSESDACNVNCIGKSIEDVINQTLDVCGGNNVVLVLQNVKFPSTRIESGWLENFPVNNIKSLTIKSAINDMGQSVFAGDPFENLKELTLEDTQISYIRKDTFKDSSLTSFAFRFTSLTAVDFEYGALQHLSGTLNILQLNNCYLLPQTIVNLTGTGLQLPLQTVDFRFNSIDHLINKSFIDLPMTVQFFLTDSNINYMEQDALYGLTKMKSLSINQNNLMTLPEGIFNYLPQTTCSLNISQNPWKCDCDMLWFKEFYEKYKATYFNSASFFCNVNGQLVDYTEVDFCPSISTSIFTTTKTPATKSSTTIRTSVSESTITKPTTTEIVTTPRTSNPTIVFSTSTESTAVTVPTNVVTPSNTPIPTENVITLQPTTASIFTTIPPSMSSSSQTIQPDNYVKLMCEDCSNDLSLHVQNNRLYSYTVAVRKGHVTYDFYELQGTPYYEIKIRNSVNDDYMVWINTEDHDDRACKYNIQEVVTLVNLNYDKKYIICLLKKYQDTVSPFDCTSLVVPPEWGQQPWVFNKDKIVVIVFYAITLIIVVAVTAIIMYCIIKRHPKFLKDSKKDIDENKLFDKEECSSQAPSMYSNSDGYLTPKVYEKIMTKRRRSRKLSTISERDFEGPFSVVYNVSEHHLYEPPPLPPNHPSRWRKLECEDDLIPPIQMNRSSSFRSERILISPKHEDVRSNSLPEGANSCGVFCHKK